MARLAAATRNDVDIVLNAIVGAAGLDATLAALRGGKRVALANKETLVIAGDLVRQACAAGAGEVVPVDSEHSAILQCITGHPTAQVRRVVLTAGGKGARVAADPRRFPLLPHPPTGRAGPAGARLSVVVVDPKVDRGFTGSA